MAGQAKGRWNLGAKLVTAGLTGVLISFGLCGMQVSAVIGIGSELQQSLAPIGVVLFVVSIFVLVAGLLIWLTEIDSEVGLFQRASTGGCSWRERYRAELPSWRRFRP